MATGMGGGERAMGGRRDENGTGDDNGRRDGIKDGNRDGSGGSRRTPRPIVWMDGWIGRELERERINQNRAGQSMGAELPTLCPAC